MNMQMSNFAYLYIYPKDIDLHTIRYQHLCCPTINNGITAYLLYSYQFFQVCPPLDSEQKKSFLAQNHMGPFFTTSGTTLLCC